MKRTIILWLSLLGFPVFVFSQAPSTNCGLDALWNLLLNGPIQTFPVLVDGYVNDDLAAAGQGVCRVELGVVHNAFKDLEIWLRSPAGQEVQLIGPNVPGSITTLLANWNMGFVRTASTAMPQPGFAARWNNDQPLNFAISGGGTYFPYSGNLEDFNTGPVNGTWTVRIQTNPTSVFLTSFVYHFRIVFCDELGNACCFAEAGRLSNIRDTTLCPGDPYLNLQPKPSYLFAIQPDTTKYGYTYVISRNDTVQSVSKTPDLRTFPIGNYQICGLSYRLTDQDSLGKIPSGVLTVDSLRRNLNSNSPWFCGDLTDNCTAIRVVDPVAIIASPEPLTCTRTQVTLDGSGSLPSGNLRYEWTNAAGTVLGTTPTLSVSTPGTYRLAVFLPGGACRVTETVEVREDKTAPGADAGREGLITCAAPVLTLGGPGTSLGAEFTYLWTTAGGRFTSSTTIPQPIVDLGGFYTLQVTDTRNGCVARSQVSIAEDLFPPVADAGPGGILTCSAANLTLGGPNTSQGGNGFTYQWTTADGRFAGASNVIRPVVDGPGTYTLEVTDGRNGCTALDAVVVTQNTTPPVADAGPAGELTCIVNSVTLGGPNTSQGGGNFTYRWTTVGGGFTSATDILKPTVGQPGNYTLQVTDTRNGCTATSSVAITRNTTPPGADAGPAATLTCAVPSTTLGGPGTSAGAFFTFQWTTPNGRFTSATNIARPEVNAAGDYTLRVADTRNGCQATASVTVAANQIPPLADAGPDVTLTCGQPSVQFDGRGSSNAAGITFQWRSLGGGPPPQPFDSPAPTVDRAGAYELVVVNTVNGCRNSDTVEVRVDTLKPRVAIAPPARLNCERTSVTLQAGASDQGANFPFVWRISQGGVIGSGAATLNPAATATGRYELLITNAANGCRDSAAVVVRDTINTLLADAGPAGVLTCDQPDLQLDGRASSAGPDIVYRWTTSNGQITSDPTAAVVTVSRVGVYELLVRDTVTACQSTATVSVSADDSAPVAEAGVGPTLTCATTEVRLDGSASTPAGQVRFQWTGPCIIDGADTAAPAVNCPGTYFLTIERLDNGCIARDSVTVTAETESPVAVARVTDTLTCNVRELSLDGGGSSAGPAMVYQWSGPGIVGGETSLSPLVNVAGIYTLEVENTSTGCSSQTSVTVARDTLAPVSDAGPDRVIDCNNTMVQLGGANSSSGPLFSYRWTATSGVITGPNTGPTLQTPFPGTYILVVTNTRNGCQTEDPVTVRLDRDPPRTDAGPDRELNCAVQRVFLNGSNSSTAGGDIVLEWSGPCLLSDPRQPIVEVDCPGVYYLRLTNTRTGCVGLDSVLVTRNPFGPRAELTDTVEINCETGSIRLDGSRSTGGLLSWWREGRLLAQNTPGIDVRDTGRYQLIVTDASLGCADTATTIVRLNCRPVAAIALPDTLSCRTELITLDAGASSQGGAFTYSWTGPAPGCVFEGDAGLQPVVLCGGTYRLIVTNTVIQQSDTAFVTVVVDTLAPLAVIGPPDLLTCTNPVVALDAGGASQGPEFSYMWSNFLGDTLGAGLTTTVNRPGAYLFEIVNTRNGCRSSVFTEVRQDGTLPAIDFGSDVFPCQQDTFRLTASVLPVGPAYRYTWSGPAILADPDRTGVLIGAGGRYTLRVTNLENGCTAADEVSVTEQVCGPCVELIMPDTLTCARPAVRLEARLCSACVDCTVQWTTLGGLLLDGTDTFTPLAGAAGVYTVVVTDPQGFSTRREVTVRADQALPAAFAGADRNLTCATTELVLGRADPTSQYRYAWTRLDGTALPNGDRSQATVRAPGVYLLTVENSRTGCRATDTVVIGIDTIPPVALAGPTKALTCQLTRVALDGSGSSIGNTLTYQWSTTNGNILTGADALNPVVDRPGRYRLRVTNQVNGCFAQDSVEVSRTADLPPVPDLPDRVLTCVDTAFVLQGVVPDAANYTFEWCRLDTNGTPLDCTDALQRAVSQPGRYRFEVTDRRTGCRNAEVVVLTENRILPQVDAGAARTIGCGDNGVRLDGSASAGAGALRLQWRGPAGGFIEEETTLRPRIFEPGVYVLTAENTTTGCRAVDSVLVALDGAAPVVQVAAPGVLTCQRRSVQLSATATTTGANAVFAWSSGDGRIVSGGTTSSPLVDRPGRYEVLVTDPANGCSSMRMVTVEQDISPPVAAIDSNGTLALTCDRRIVTLDGRPSRSPGGQAPLFDWRAQGDQSILGNPGGPVVQVVAGGKYQLIVTAPDNGCRDTLDINILNNTLPPDVVIAPPGPITCGQRSVTINGGASAIGPDIEYTWRNAFGDVVAQGVPRLTVQQGGTYQLFLRNRATGCENRSAATVQVDTLPPVARIAPPGELDCDQRTIELDGSASSSGADFEYSWFFGAGNIVSGQRSKIAVVDAPGLYTLSVRNRRNGCGAAASVTVEEFGTPISGAAVTVTPPTCDGDGTGAIRIDSISGGVGPFVYALEDDRFTTRSSFGRVPPGDYRIRVQDSNGCEWEGRALMPAAPVLSVDLGLDVTIELGDSVRLKAEVNGGPYDRLTWSPADTLIAQGKPEQWIRPTETTTYSVMVEAQGCRAMDQITVTVAKGRDLFIPNAFSPDGDGVNDRFTFYAGRDVRQIRSLKIFDRWGTLVFETGAFAPNDVAAGWDGALNGRRLNAAVFVYFAEVEFIDGWRETMKGEVLLIR